MSIKSDRWIKKQCAVPTHTDDTGKYHTLDSQPEKLLVFFGGTLAMHPVTDEELAKWKPMIEPFHAEQVRKTETGARVISYGLSSYGYDVRCSTEFKVFTNVNTAVVDPKNFDDNCYVTKDGTEDGYVIIPPNGFALAHTVEYFRIPRDILVICLGKSTFARCGIIVNVTPLEPEWEGQVVLEFSNTTSLPAKIYVNEGVAQFLFLQADEDDVCEVSYADRGGKYQGQTGITLPKA